MLLGGDTVPEIDLIKSEVPDIEDFKEDLLKLRAMERVKFGARFGANLHQ